MTTYLPREKDRGLIEIHSIAGRDIPCFLRNGFVKPVQNLLGFDKVNTIYKKMPASLPVDDFCRRALELLDVSYAVTEQEISQIPQKGPLVVVANHPFGGIEGIILTELLLRVRNDIRILGNYLLTRIPDLASKIIAVDPFSPRKSVALNATALKKAVGYLARGGVLLTFPAGEVSSVQLTSGCICDPPWSPHIARLIRLTNARVLPVYIHGRNSVMFNLLGLLHPRLRTALLPRELFNKCAGTITLSIGSPVPAQRVAGFRNEYEAISFLRFNTYLLKHRKIEARPAGSVLTLAGKRQRRRPIIAPVAKRLLREEIGALPSRNLLVDQKAFQAFWATADQAPYIMREIARLREISFRNVGEGTGKSMDLDAFDKHYHHLFLWHAENEEVVGAYRIGRTDHILNQQGVGGLYTTTLFAFKTEFFNHFSKALELGRSFIRIEYQKKFGCLAILWRGIGAYIAGFPQYRFLFGPVSISQHYNVLSKNLMVEFLRRNTMDTTLSAMVRPRCAMRRTKRPGHAKVRSLPSQVSIEDVSMLVAEIEDDRKGVPTLVRHYLKLNGKFLGFNLDKAFGNVIDGLVMVDLLKTDPKIVQRFLGEAGMREFFLFHEKNQMCAA